MGNRPWKLHLEDCQMSSRTVDDQSSIRQRLALSMKPKKQQTNMGYSYKIIFWVICVQILFFFLWFVVFFQIEIHIKTGQYNWSIKSKHQPLFTIFFHIFSLNQFNYVLTKINIKGVLNPEKKEQLLYSWNEFVHKEIFIPADVRFNI